MAVKYLAGNRLTGSNSDRTGFTTTNLLAGSQWLETDTNDIYHWDGSSWDLVVGDSIAETLANKTLTSPIIGTSLLMAEDATIIFEGATANANETILTVVDPTGDRTVSLPNATDTLVGKATTDTLTNKTVVHGSSGNSITGLVNASIDGSAGIVNSKLAGPSLVISDGSNTSNIALGGTLVLAATSNETTVAESSGTVTIGIVTNPTLSGNVSITGNLTVSGDTITANVGETLIEDSLLSLATANSANSIDIGWYGKYVSSGTKYAGMFWDAGTGVFYPRTAMTSVPTTTWSGGSAAGINAGIITATELDISGNIDIDGISNLDVVDIDGAVQIDATFTSGVDGQGYDTKFFGDTLGAYILWDTSADKLLTVGGALIDIVKDKLMIGGTAVTTTAAELNILDTATVTAAELNLIDGGTSRGTTAVASGDGILINDDGTMRMTNVDTVSTYFSSHNVGGTSIVTVGTIATGVWEGTTVAVAQGGTGATSLNNLITLATHTTGNYVATITGGTGITSSAGTSGEGTTHSLSVDASQTQITSVGTIGTGVWNGTAIASGYIAADAITGAKIADDAIDSEHYTDGSIDNAHIADDAIDSEHYADGSIDNAHIADDAIDSEHYVNSSVDNAHLANSAVTITAGTGATGGGSTSLGASSTINVIGGDGITANANDMAITALQTTITSILNASLVVGRDADNDIDFTTDNNIRFRAGGEDQLTLTDGALTPSSNAIVDLGTDALEFKDAYFDGTLEADAITIGGTNVVTGSLITTLGTISAGTWQATDIGVAYGGTGVSTLLANAVLTGNGASAIQAETTLLFSSNKLIPTASAHNVAGTVLTMSAGSTTAGTTNNIAGGALTFQGGQGKGSGAGGAIIFQTADAGGSGSSLNALAETMRLTDGGNVLIGGDEAGANEYELMTVRAGTYDQISHSVYSTTDGHATNLYFRKSHHDTLGTMDATTDGETIGIINFVGVNSSDGFDAGAIINVSQVGASSGKVPVDMTFSTSTNAVTAEVMKLSSAGNVEVKTALSIGGFVPAFDLDVADNDAHTQVGITTYSDSTHSSYLYLRKSHNDTLGTVTETIDGETLGKIYFNGVDSGGGFDSGAAIIGVQTGSAGAKVPTYLKFETATSSASAEVMRIRETGAVQIGGAGIAQRTDGMLDINASDTYPRLSVTSWSASDKPAYLQLSQSQNDTMGTKTATADGATHGYIRFEGVDSAGNFDLGCSISSQQDGASGTRVPANLIFTTSTSSSPTEKMRIMGTGLVGIGTNAPDHLLTLTSSVATSQIELRGAGIAGGGGFFTNYGNQNCVMSAGVRANAGSWTADTTASGGAGAAAIYNQQNSTHYWYSNGSLTDGSNFGPTQVFTIVLGGDATLAGTLTESSDARLKTNISTIGSALDKVTQMRGVSFDRIDNNTSSVGLIAQELEQIAPELVLDNEEYKSVAYTKLTAYLIEAIKELNNEIKELKGN